MNWITLGEAKAHLRIELDETSEDVLIVGLIDAAKSAIEAHLNRSLVTSSDDITDDAMLINGAVKAAGLLCIGHLYENRESVKVGVSAVELPLGFNSLLSPYRIQQSGFLVPTEEV